MTTLEADVKVDLVLALFSVNGQQRFHVHVPTPDGAEDVTDQYQLVAAVDPGTGQRGFTLLKKSPTPIQQEK